MTEKQGLYYKYCYEAGNIAAAGCIIASIAVSIANTTEIFFVNIGFSPLSLGF